MFALVAASPNPAASPMRANTTKSLNEFGSCFTRVEERVSRAWAFLPTPSGGTFTNSGASSAAAAPYRLAFDEAKPLSQVRLFAGQAATGLVAAVRLCL